MRVSDLSVTSYLDIESLVFLAEKFADAMIREDENGVRRKNDVEKTERTSNTRV